MVFHIKLNLFESKTKKVMQGWRNIRKDELIYFSLYNVLVK